MAKKKQKKATKSKNGAKKRAPNTRMAMHLAMGVCSVSNPFCPEAVGARWPDNSITRSAYWGIRGAPVAALTTNASGQVGFLLVPDFGSTQAGVASGTWPSLNFTTLAPIVTFPTNVSRYRITSAGYKISGVVAPLSASGVIRVRLYSPATGSSLSAVTMDTIMADAIYDIPVSSIAGKDHYINLMPLGEQLSRVYRSPSAFTTTLANWINPGWQIASIAIDQGPASTAVANVYAYIHYEVVFNDGDSQNMFATAPPSSSLVVREATAGVLQSTGNFFEGAAAKIDSFFQSKAMKLVGTALAGAYGGPQAAMQTYGAIGGMQSVRAIRDVD